MNVDFPRVSDPLACALLTHLDHWSREPSFEPENTIAAVRAGEPPLGSFRALLGRDKTWLVLLSSPLVTAKSAEEVVAALKWCIDVGLHELYSAQLHAGTPVESGPRVELVTSTSLEKKPSELYDKNLLTSADFSRELTKLLKWKSMQNYDHLEFPGGMPLETIAEFIDSHCSLPLPSARLLFSGIPNIGNRSEPAFDKLMLKRIGLTASRVITAEWMYRPNGLEPVRELLLGLVWHPEYFAYGPHLEAFTTWWSHRYGPKWISLTEDEFWDLTTTAETAYGGYGEITSIRDTLRFPNSSQRVDSSGSNMATLLNVAMYIAPQSSQALAIANSLRGRRSQRSELTDTVAEVYEETRDFNDPRLRSTSRPTEAYATKKGHLDEWLEWLRHGTFTELTSRDPRVSAPQAVQRIQHRHRLSENAACYFLQLSVLTVPKDAWVKQWNHWSATQLKDATAELTNKGLVVQDKRPSAGRSVFIPGRWHKRSDDGPAMEEPKLGLYMAWRSVASRPLIQGAPPLKPLGLLFEEVARVQ